METHETYLPLPGDTYSCKYPCNVDETLMSETANLFRDPGLEIYTLELYKLTNIYRSKMMCDSFL